MGTNGPWQEAQLHNGRRPAVAGTSALRIFGGDADADGSGASRNDSGSSEPSASWTLSRLFRDYFAPVTLVARDARARYLEELRISVAYWVRFTGDPPLERIDQFTCRDFIVGLKSLPGRRAAQLAANTVRKHASAIQEMLDVAGPPDRQHRDALGILERPPYVPRPPAEIKEAEDCFTLDELQRLLDNADAAHLPKDLPCSPGTYHRRLCVATFNLGGLRIGGIMQATWRHWHGDHLLLPARNVAKGRRDQRVEVNEVAAAVIESMRGCDAERIFPWPHAWPGSRHCLYAQLALVRACLAPDRQFGFHGIRKLTNNELTQINPKACEKVLGHQLGRTNTESYTSRQVARQALDRLPRLNLSPEHQRLLF